MKKKALLAAAAIAALMVPQVAGAEGFGIVEWSAEGVAMGGARMFAENDVSMVAANPASLTKFQGKGVGVNATYISPHGTYDAFNGNTKIEHGENRVHPGIVPGMYYVQQMTDKDWWGIGAYTRYGMVSGFQPGSVAATGNLFSKMNGLSITPVYAHKFDKKWSAAVGAEINYVGLELNQEMYPFVKYGKQDKAQYHLKGDSYALGWNAAVNYSFDEKNDFGVVYRSKVKHSLEANLKTYGSTVIGSYPISMNSSGDAYGEVTLPDQWTIGYNHRFDKKNRVELNATRTNWHTYDALNITFSGLTGVAGDLNRVHPSNKAYSDTWRYAIGYEHKFSDKYSGMLGYAWDDHAIPYDGGDFMVPTGVRRTYSCGLQYHDKKQTVAFAVAWEDISGLTFKGNLKEGNAFTEASSKHNSAKVFSIGYSYHF